MVKAKLVSLTATLTGMTLALWELTSRCQSSRIGNLQFSHVVTRAYTWKEKGDYGRIECECYAFAADHHARILNWIELPGSHPGEYEHEKIIKEVCERLTPA